MNFILFLTFSLSFLLSLIIIKLPVRYLINDSDLLGVQKMHYKPIARLGGVAVFISFSVALWLLPYESETLLLIWLSSLPVFIGGLIEDLTAKVSPLLRLSFIFTSIFIMFFVLDLGIDSLGFVWIDSIFSNYMIIGLIFTLLMVAGAVNSLNIIDGMNGLKGGYSIIASLAIVYVAHILGDILIFQLGLIFAFSILGFFILNFPFGKIFMGDGGAYFVGFILAIIGLLFVKRHDELSNWFVLLIFIYPMYELLFSMFRRKFINNSVIYEPDALHLHSLIYKKIISHKSLNFNKVLSNSVTSPFLWILSLFGIIPATIWYESDPILIFSAILFMSIYSLIYKLIS